MHRLSQPLFVIIGLSTCMCQPVIQAAEKTNTPIVSSNGYELTMHVHVDADGQTRPGKLTFGLKTSVMVPDSIQVVQTNSIELDHASTQRGESLIPNPRSLGLPKRYVDVTEVQFNRFYYLLPFPKPPTFPMAISRISGTMSLNVLYAQENPIIMPKMSEITGKELSIPGIEGISRIKISEDRTSFDIESAHFLHTILSTADFIDAKGNSLKFWYQIPTSIYLYSSSPDAKNSHTFRFRTPLPDPDNGHVRLWMFAPEERPLTLPISLPAATLFQTPEELAESASKAAIARQNRRERDAARARKKSATSSAVPKSSTISSSVPQSAGDF